MRPLRRPSANALLVTGALVLTLVVGATSGAVAGSLITSKDIKDNTIKSRDIRNGTIGSKDLREDAVRGDDLAPGAVTWDKSLDQSTKDLIEGLVQAGPPGAAGPAGPPGPAGTSGGELVGSEIYEAGDFVVVNDGTTGGGPLGTDPSDPFSQVDPSAADLIDLPGPGTYLISVQAASLLGPALVFFDDPGPVVDLFDDDTAIEIFSRSCTSSGLAVGCQATIPYVVPSGAPASVPLDVFAVDCGCGAPDHVAVTVFKMDDTPAVYSKIRRPALRGSAARQFAARVEELRDEWLSAAS